MGSDDNDSLRRLCRQPPFLYIHLEQGFFRISSYSRYFSRKTFLFCSSNPIGPCRKLSIDPYCCRITSNVVTRYSRRACSKAPATGVVLCIPCSIARCILWFSAVR